MKMNKFVLSLKIIFLYFLILGFNIFLCSEKINKGKIQKIAISSNGKTLDSLVCHKFAQCKYFILYDTKSKKFKTIINEALSETHRRGHKTAELLIKNNIGIALTGNLGANAMKKLTKANIGVALDIEGTVKDVIEKYINRKYKILNKH